MEAGVVGSIIGATVQVVLQNLLSISAEEINVVRDFKKDLEKLKDSLLMIQDFLCDAEKQQVNRKAVKRWLNKLEALAFDADDVLDEFSYQVLCKKMEIQNKIKQKVQALFSSNRKMAHKIRDINNKLKSISEEAMGFGLQTIRYVGGNAHGVGSDSFAYRETDSYSVDPIVFGRENDVSRIVEMLINSTSRTHGQIYSVLAIVGMGGIGKTTLARQVFHDEKIKTHFEKLIWVYVSENFDVKGLFRKILESLTGQKVEFETRDALLGKLQDYLEAKKYILVLDDVWIEDTEKWDDFIDTLSRISSVKGNGIIVTTRSEKVASIVRTISILELSKLLDKDCWSIIKGKAFTKGYIIPSEVETIGKKIAKRCQGLPLAAKVVGGLLRCKSKDEWHSIDETMLSELRDDGNIVMKILKLSFDNLPSQSLKKCFAYCSIFPKGSLIKRGILNKLWMAEGFLQSDQHDMETVGNRYFDLLLQNSLLQVVWRDDNDNIVTHCNMHDLVHDLARSILDETGPIRYISMKSITEISKEEARNLRSVIFEGKIFANIFSEFKRLHGLVLIDYDDTEELPKMEHLIHMRYLDISRTRIKCLPKWVGNLYHLQTLRANNGLKVLPKTIKNLINLRHLHIQKLGHKQEGIRNEEIPMLWQLPHLKTLYLTDLPNVKSLGSSLDINGDGKNDAVIVFPALESLSLSFMPNLVELLPTAREMVAFPRLEYLMLSNCRKLTSASSSRFPSLKELEINWMDNNSLLESLLLNLTSLTKLTIVGVEGLVCLPDVFFCNNQNLSYFKITHCGNLTHLAPRFLDCGACLKELVIDGCQNLEELPEDLHCLNSLENLDIQSCPKLKSIPYHSSGSFTSLCILKIVNCQRLTELPSGMLESCALSLQIVSFCGLTGLTNTGMIVTCLQKMPHLTALSFQEFPYNNVPFEIGSFRSLRDLSISGVGERYWESLPDQLQHLTALRFLELRQLMGIDALPEWLGKLSSLEVLRLLDCEKLRSLPSKEAVQCLAKLNRLDIHFCPLLEKRCRRERQGDEDSEWHKICHIPQVNVLSVKAFFNVT